MHEIIENILGLSEENRMVYLDIIYEDRIIRDQFHSFLKGADEESRNSFVDSNTGSYTERLKGWIDNAVSPDNEDLRIIDDKLKTLFGEIEPRKALMKKNSKLAKEKTLEYRNVMKAGLKFLSNHLTDQDLDLEKPELTKKITESDDIVSLPAPDRAVVINSNIFECIENRKSRRKFLKDEVSLNELSYLLWATQGVRKTFKHRIHSLRTVPSGGARHPFETYIAVNSVTGLKPGLYRYQPFEHELVYLYTPDNMVEKLKEGSLGQSFAGNCALSFIWTAIPYRTEWRYSVESKKIILQDSGHLCQNLYLACESINCGTCAIGAYDQDLMDSFLKVDGVDEFTIYISPVGKYS